MSDQNHWDETLQLVDLACADEISLDEISKLEASLLSDCEAKEYYLAYFRLHTELQVAVRVDRALQAVEQKISEPSQKEPSQKEPRQKESDQKQIITLRDQSPASPHLGFMATKFSQVRTFFEQPPVLSVCVAVLVVLNVLVALSLIYTNNSPSNDNAKDYSLAEDSQKKQVVAWVSYGIDAVWDEKFKGKKRGDELRLGDKLVLKQGLVEIAFANDTVVILQGPAQFEVRGKNSGRLSLGKLTALVSPKAKGFTVVSPTSRLVDIGTEFGVQVETNGSTLLNVFEGKVEASPKMPDGTYSVDKKQILNAGKSLWIMASGDTSSGQPSEIQFVRAKEFTASRSYNRWQQYQRKLKADANLVAYYTFTEEDRKANQLKNQSSAFAGKLTGILGDSKNNRTKPAWTDGRWPEKAALRFNRANKQRVVVPYDQAFDLHDELTLSAWIKCSGSDLGGVIAGKREMNGKAIYRIAAVAEKFLPNQNRRSFDFQVVSIKASDTAYTNTVGANSWRHLVFTVNQSQLKFYINGKLIQSKPCTKGDFLNKGNFYIGGSEITSAHFDGLIDEVALLSRSMSEHEVLKMYRAGSP